MRFTYNSLNKKWLKMTLFLGIFLFLFISFSQIGLARELENDYPKIPLPGVGGLSLNDIYEALDSGTGPAADTFKDKPLSALILYFYTFSIMLVGIIAFGVIIMTGVKFMASGASPGMRKEAMDQLRAVIFGIALLLGSWLLLNTINPELTLLSEPGQGIDRGWFKGEEDAFGGYTSAGLTGTGIERIGFAITTAPPHDSTPIKPGETALLSWKAPEGAGDCVAYSNPVIDTWGRGTTLVDVPGEGKRGRQVPTKSPKDGYKLIIDNNQREGTYNLHIRCVGTNSTGDGQITVSQLSQGEINNLPKAIVDLKLQKIGGLLLDNVTLSPGEKTDGDFKYIVTGAAIDQNTIGRCTFSGGDKEIGVNNIESGTINTVTFGFSPLIPDEYVFSCLDKRTNIEIGRDTVVVTIFEDPF